jgi:penicillin-binding protein 1A
MRSQRDIEAELDALVGRKKHHWWRWVLLALGSLFGLILLVAVGAGFVIYQRLTADLPQVSELEHYQPSLVTKVYDRYGELIADFFIEKRILVPLTDIPMHVRQATIAVTHTGAFTRTTA